MYTAPGRAVDRTGRWFDAAVISAFSLLLAACSGAPPAPPAEGAPAPASGDAAKPADDKKAEAPAAPAPAAEAAKPADDKKTEAPAASMPADDKTAKPPAAAKTAEEKKAAAPADAKPAGDKKAGAPETGADEATDVWKSRLAQIEKDSSVDAQQRALMAQRLVEEAIVLKREFKYTQALDTVRRALRMSPDHPEARKLELEIGSLLDQYPSRPKAAGENAVNDAKVREQQMEAEIDNHVEKGKRYLADRRFVDAIEEFRSAEIKLEAIPYDIPLKRRIPEIQALTRRAQDDKAAFQRLTDVESQEKAKVEAEKEEERRQNEIKQSVRNLLRKAIENFEQKRYDRCAELCDEILYIDPHYRAAVDLRDHAYKARHKQEYADYLTSRITEWKKVVTDDEEQLIPYSETLRFPDRDAWARISKRVSAVSAAEEKEHIDPDILAMRNKLDSLKIELDFQEAKLDDVVEFIRQFSGISIVIDQAVRGDAAIMDKKISFKVKNLVLARVLNLLLEQYNLKHMFKEKVLYITKPENVVGDAVLGLHDVRDLLVKIQDYPGPTIELTPPGAAAGGRAGGGGVAGATFTLDEPKTPGVTEEQIVNLIKANVAPGSWEGGKYSIQLATNSQQLLVNHTPEVQREIREFLGKLRQYAGAMVSVESRFLAAHDNFLEDVGLDIRGLQDVGGPVNASTGAQISTSASARTPATVVDYNDRTGQNEPGFIARRDSNAERYDLRFRQIGSFLADLGAGGTMVNEGGTPGYILGNRLADRGGLGIQYFFLGAQELNFVLRAVKKSEKAVIVNSPRVTVFNTQRSNIFIATQRAYISDFDVEVSTGTFALDPTIGYVQDGVVLDVRPIISNDRRYIHMEIRTTFADFQGFRTVLIDPPINAILQLPYLVVEKAETTVRIPDRGTLIISGLKDILSRDLISTVPILGDLPIINFFFSRKAKGIERRKLFILVTAEIIELGEHLAKQKQPPP